MLTSPLGGTVRRDVKQVSFLPGFLLSVSSGNGCTTQMAVLVSTACTLRGTHTHHTADNRRHLLSRSRVSSDSGHDKHFFGQGASTKI
jgi:hypothetical protein